jgi:hypothetical protein
MKVKYVGEANHMVVFVERTYVMFEKDETRDVADDDGFALMAKYPGQFEKEEKPAAKAAPKAKVLPEVVADESKQ